MHGHRESLEEWKRFIVADSHVLTENPSLFFQQAANQPVEDSPSRLAEARFLAGLEKRIWLRRLNKSGFRPAILTLRGHLPPENTWVHTCRYSPAGRRILSASNDATLKIWDAKTGELQALLRGHRDSVIACSFSPDGARIVSASKGGEIKLWESESGRELASVEDETFGEVRICIFSPDGKIILTAASRHPNLEIRDANSLSGIATLKGHADAVWSAVFSPDASRILSGSQDQSLGLWDAKTGENLLFLRGHRYTITSCAFSPDGSRLLSSALATMKLWDARTGKELAALEGHSDFIRACVFSPDGRQILSAAGLGDSSLRLWSASSGEETAALEGHRGGVNDCAFSPDGAFIVSAAEDGTLRLWDAGTGQNVRILIGHGDSITTCAFSPDGKNILSASKDGTIRVWKVPAREAPRDILTGPEYACAFSPNGDMAASASVDGTLAIWDAESGARLAKLPGQERPVHFCAFSPDGSRLLTISRRAIALWDVGNGTRTHVLDGHSDHVNYCSFSPDGRAIASASKDRSVKVWDAVNGAEWATLEGHAGEVDICAWTPDGRYILSLDNFHDELKVWDFKTGEEVESFNKDASWGDPSFTLRDGRRVSYAWASQQLYDRDSREILMTPRWHCLWPQDCAVSSDGCLSVYVSPDKILSLSLASEPGNSGADRITGKALRSSGSSAASIAKEGSIGIYYLNGKVDSLDWSPKGTHLALCEGGQFVLLKIENLAPRRDASASGRRR